MVPFTKINTREALLGPGQFPLYLVSDADFHMVCLKIEIMCEYGVSFKSVRYLQEYGSFHFYSRCEMKNKIVSWAEPNRY